ncbi:serine/threonine protein kinase, partial [Hyalangium sp.]|uniref:serine/threonine protein kinase n=1 Tax=Hyalangium sp. TaxID=2028555 RepID=UPI002D2BEA42
FLARTEGPRGFSKTLVLKRILPHLAGDEQFVEMFLSEARLVAQINHPNVVQIFDFGDFDGSYYIAMEFIDGPNLRALMRRAVTVGESLPPALCAKIVASACEGLAHAHDLVDPQTQQPLGLVHRDVSPDNILIARNGTVKVVDFGIAKALGQKDLTKAGTVKGKLPYMPPEQMRGRPLDRRVDVFALGMVLYELLTFKRPFNARIEADIMEAILHKPMKRLKEHLPQAPEALERIVQRCLAKEREDRYPSCRQLRADLERFILSAGEPVGAEEVAALVERLMPATHGPSPADPVSSSSKSPAPRALLQATPPPFKKPRGPVARVSPPKAPVVEPEDEDLPLPDEQDMGTNRSIVSLVSRNAGPPGAGASLAAPPSSTERSAQELLPEASWEMGQAPTAQLSGWGRHQGRAVLMVALLGSVMAVVSGAIILRRAVLSWEREVPPVVAPAAPVTEPAPLPAPAAELQTEPTDVLPPAPAEPEPAVESPGLQADPASSPDAAEAGAERSEEPGHEPAAEPVKPAVLAKRGKVRAGGGNTWQRRWEVKAEESEPLQPTREVAPPAPPAAPPPSAAQPRLATAVFSSSPPAQIRVNGQFVGLSPVTLRNLTPGTVHVEVYDSVKGFSKQRTFDLEPGDNGVLKVSVERATLELRIHPYAVVILDGKHLGPTPLEPISLYEGKHGLRLENEELGKHLITTLTIGPGEAHVFKFNMEDGK